MAITMRSLSLTIAQWETVSHTIRILPLNGSLGNLRDSGGETCPIEELEVWLYYTVLVKIISSWLEL